MTIETDPSPAGRLAGKVVVVTGAGGVIGATLARGFADSGASVVITDLDAPESLAEEIRAAGGAALAVATDVTDTDDADAMAAAAETAYGRIDALVNNAGFFRSASRGAFSDIPVSEWDTAFTVNVQGLWNCARAVLPQLRRSGAGRIVNVGSNTVFRGVPFFLHYVASKAGVIGLTRGLARELGEDNISANVLYPDFIPDDALKAAQPGNNERLVKLRCFQRTQVPEDLVGAARFLVSDESSFVTGQSIVVNGGAYFH